MSPSLGFGEFDQIAVTGSDIHALQRTGAVAILRIETNSNIIAFAASFIFISGNIHLPANKQVDRFGNRCYVHTQISGTVAISFL